MAGLIATFVRTKDSPLRSSMRRPIADAQQAASRVSTLSPALVAIVVTVTSPRVDAEHDWRLGACDGHQECRADIPL